jgi:hypothetical protein
VDDILPTLPPPGRTWRDVISGIAQAGAEATAASVGLPAPSAAAQAVELLLRPWVGANIDDWLHDLAIRLTALEQRIATITPQALAVNRSFLHALAAALPQAARTDDPTKRTRLTTASSTPG